MKLGIIGGSGLEDPKLLKDFREIEINTPYGKPSSSITNGKIGNVEVFILSRHGRKHTITPTNVNNRANIYALAKLGCKYIIATTAAGSLREEIKRGDFVILDQFIDFTRHRHITFHDNFEKGVFHESLADPFSFFLRKKIISACKELNIPHHEKGTVITIEGPRFSTRAESNIFRSWRADVINMSIAPEAILAREAGLEYAAIAMSTDYDCWKQDEDAVTWEAILKIFSENADKVKRLLVKVIEDIEKPEQAETGFENQKIELGNQVREKEKIEEEFELIEKQLKELEAESITEIEKTADNNFEKDAEFIKSKIRTIPHWPKQGVMFRDITTLLKDAESFNKTLSILENRYKNKEIDLIAGIESRGFIIASALASRLGKGIILVRKPGKLPAETIREEYELEYGKDALEIHKDAIQQGQKILLIDDLIAVGGTSLATCNLIEKLGGNILECAFIIELPELGGRKKLENKGHNVFSIVKFEGE